MNEQSTELVSRIWDDSRLRLKNFIARKINNQADVEDVLQNVFCKIHQNIHQLENADKLYSWVYQLTRNAIIDYYRDSKSRLNQSGELLNEIAFETVEKDVEEEVLGWLNPMVNDLPDKYREALLMTDIQGLTQKQLSEKLDISISGAKSRVQRAREQLKQVLVNCCLLEFNRAGTIVEYKQRGTECRYCADH
jgi:RNA polymerase sigma-70 factor, ECF subfamily